MNTNFRSNFRSRFENGRNSLTIFGSRIRNQTIFRFDFPAEKFGVGFAVVGVLVLLLGLLLTNALSISFAWLGVPLLVAFVAGIAVLVYQDIQDAENYWPWDEYRDYRDRKAVAKAAVAQDRLHNVILGDKVVTIDENHNVVGNVRHTPKGLISPESE